MTCIRMLHAVSTALSAAALTILPASASASPEAAQQLEIAYEVLACSSHADALPQLLRAAAAGSAEAQALVGRLYVAGGSLDRGVPRDEARGIRWMRQAAEAGQPDAQRYVTALELRADEGARGTAVAGGERLR